MEKEKNLNIFRRWFLDTNAAIQFSAIIAGLCAFSIGLNMSILDSAAAIFMECSEEDSNLKRCVQCTKNEWSFFVSILSLGAPFAIYLSKYTSLSKKKFLLIANALYIIGFSIIAFTYNYLSVVLGRFIVGCGVGLCSVNVPLYISYLSKNKLIINYNQLFIIVGIFSGQVLSLGFTNVDNWKIRLYINLMFLLCHTFLLLLIKNVEFSVESTKKSIFSIFTSKEGRKAIFPALSIHIGRQLSCVNNVIQYSTMLIASSLSPAQIVLSISCVMMLCTILHFYLIATIKRRTLLLISLLITSFGLFMMSSGKFIEFTVAIYILGYTIGLGPIPWNILGNIFPPEYKEVGSNIAVGVNWITCFAFSYIFPIIFTNMGKMCYTIFGSIIFVLAIYISIYGKAI
ncbi:putative sugar transporter [Hamiltosporidium tvaerminnensis]|uniref:Putative sugar transporter n=1 Tax=Hamiltosporidium tvaerminnensis TaxID=1176355 RepID=A0A4Q9M1E7_9MICR|nr:putative sugar transporter [Hamiltosporidium tvaerminnensis]